MANPDIAQAFITRKTVEKQVSNALAKLRITTRDEIGEALQS